MKMKQIKMKYIKTLLACAALLLAASQATAQKPARSSLTDAERRGKMIYLKGVSTSGKEISAFLGDATTEIPANAMPCSNCHGLDGRGKPEGGVVPSEITWGAMTKSYGVTHASGRKHPAYTDAALEAAIRKGVDPAGNRLTDAMPRYWMSREDLSDLVAYMKRLGSDADPGVSESAITIGTILPGHSALAETSEAMKAALRAYFEEINSQGGIYNRKLELRVVEPAGEGAKIKSSVSQFVESEQVFAIAGGVIAGAEEEIASLAEEKEVVMVGPSTLNPQQAAHANRHVFYLFSGLREECRALVNFIGEKLQKQQPRLSIIAADRHISKAMIEAIEAQAKSLGYNSVSKSIYTANRVDWPQLARQASESDAVFFLGTGDEQAAFAKAAMNVERAPYLLIPGSLAGREILDAPAAFKERVFLSFPTLPSDQSADAVMEFRIMAGRHNLSTRNVAAQLSAVAAAKILVEGLKLAGKELSREKLINALEGLYNFETGLTPRITFGPNKRIGALGAYVVGVDLEKKQFIPASGWIIPD